MCITVSFAACSYMEPAEAGAPGMKRGVQFVWDVTDNSLHTSWAPPIEKGFREVLQRGLLSGNKVMVRLAACSVWAIARVRHALLNLAVMSRCA